MFDRLPMRQIKIDLCPTFDPTSVSIHLKQANRGHSYDPSRRSTNYFKTEWEICTNALHPFLFQHSTSSFQIFWSYWILLTLTCTWIKDFLTNSKSSLLSTFPPPCHVCVMWFCWLHLLVTSSWGNLWPSVKQLQWKLALQTWFRHKVEPQLEEFKYLRILFMRRQWNGRSAEGSMQCQRWCGHCWR